MKKIKVGLNGFGRIGRAFSRVALDRGNFEIVAINTRKTPPKMLAYLLQYDSIYRKYGKKVTSDENSIMVDGVKIAATQVAEPGQIPWDQYGVDVVVDATGAFENAADLQSHIKGSVKKVVLTAPSKEDDMPHVVLGVNNGDIAKGQIISNCSCTTNSASPIFKVLDDNFKIVSGFLTTVHAYTSTQELLDDPSKSPERSRSATLNTVPSTTGAAKAVVRTMPQLKGKIDGMSIRVPVPTVSFSDVSVVTEKPTTIEEVNSAFKQASEGAMKGILAYETEILVSSDYIGSPYSCIFDANYTKVINGTFIKVFGWYDNEWGYSTRLVDLVEQISDSI